ncbi:MAG: hypothetical protein Q8R79_05645, partial [Legionellaceae bacterium]|nr:hypothetical protein [Legionellaceae bacterium]
KSAHRCPIALLEVAQHTLDLIPMINPNQKHAITADRNLLQMPSSTLHAGKRFWVEPSKEVLAQIHRLCRSADVIVIASAEDFTKYADSVAHTPLHLQPQRTIGLEFSTIILLEPLSWLTEAYSAWSPTKHKLDIDLALQQTLLLFTNITRSADIGIFVQSNLHEVKALMKHFKKLTFSTNLQALPTEHDTPEDWYQRACQLLEEGNDKHANDIFEKFKEAFEKLGLEKPQPVVNTKTQTVVVTRAQPAQAPSTEASAQQKAPVLRPALITPPIDTPSTSIIPLQSTSEYIFLEQLCTLFNKNSEVSELLKFIIPHVDQLYVEIRRDLLENNGELTKKILNFYKPVSVVNAEDGKITLIKVALNHLFFLNIQKGILCIFGRLLQDNLIEKLNSLVRINIQGIEYSVLQIILSSSLPIQKARSDEKISWEQDLQHPQYPTPLKYYTDLSVNPGRSALKFMRDILERLHNMSQKNIDVTEALRAFFSCVHQIQGTESFILRLAKKTSVNPLYYLMLVEYYNYLAEVFTQHPEYQKIYFSVLFSDPLHNNLESEQQLSIVFMQAMKIHLLTPFFRFFINENSSRIVRDILYLSSEYPLPTSEQTDTKVITSVLIQLIMGNLQSSSSFSFSILLLASKHNSNKLITYLSSSSTYYLPEKKSIVTGVPLSILFEKSGYPIYEILNLLTNTLDNVSIRCIFNLFSSATLLNIKEKEQFESFYLLMVACSEKYPDYFITEFLPKFRSNIMPELSAYLPIYHSKEHKHANLAIFSIIYYSIVAIPTLKDPLDLSYLKNMQGFLDTLNTMPQKTQELQDFLQQTQPIIAQKLALISKPEFFNRFALEALIKSPAGFFKPASLKSGSYKINLDQEPNGLRMNITLQKMTFTVTISNHLVHNESFLPWIHPDTKALFSDISPTLLQSVMKTIREFKKPYNKNIKDVLHLQNTESCDISLYTQIVKFAAIINERLYLKPDGLFAELVENDEKTAPGK